jgi:hypothetical protein
MNVFTVEWLDEAEQELAAIWARDADRAAVTKAQAQIEGMLARAPLHHGTHLSEGLYSITVHPLLIFFSVDTSRRVVEVSWVTRIP